MVKHTGLEFFGTQAETPGAVECLGLTFQTDLARREHFLGRLREHLKDPNFRRTPGFPVGEDEDILALSDPPYYTACPNPFLAEVIASHRLLAGPTHGKYVRDPFASDVSANKSDPAYNVHAYPTKVPPDAISPLLSHFTEPGSVVLDPFSGTGMMGVAAQRLGKGRVVVLTDLSPLATHISNAMTLTARPDVFASTAEAVLTAARDECGWMYKARFGRLEREVRYFVWSDVYLCDGCGSPVRVYDIEGIESIGGLKKRTPCVKCGALISKASMEPLHETYMDNVLGRAITHIKSEPVLKVTVTSNRSTKVAVTNEDLRVLEEVASRPIPHAVPTAQMLFRDGCWGDQWRSSYHRGITHSHQFYTPRNLWILAAVWERIQNTEPFAVRRALQFWFTASLSRLTRLNRYMAQHNRHVGPLSGTLFLNPIQAEISPFYFMAEKKKEVEEFLQSLQRGQRHRVFVGTGSSEATRLPDQSVDYVFTDPPFGDNLMYSELNFLGESWLRVFTNQSPEAVVSKSQGKDIDSFQRLVEKVFAECSRVLKPGRWLTLEFHNSRNAVWTAIQEALGRAGFVVADVRTLDKEKGTTKQQTQAGTVKQDLIISAYKPDSAFEQQFKIATGTGQGAWEFIAAHLRHLPVFVSKAGCAENIAERQGYLLFDRMVAFHVQRSLSVPLSAAEFYSGLKERFPCRDGMFFLPEQLADYETKRLQVARVEQYELFVSDERSAIQWVRRQLTDQPATYQELSPLYMREAQKVWEKHEKPLELRAMLEQNFMQDGSGRWSIPDPKNDIHIEQLRTRALLKEFEQYREMKGKLKIVRTEALRAGFRECWQKKDYATIVQMARRLPEAVVQEDQALLMYVDNASLLKGE